MHGVACGLFLLRLQAKLSLTEPRPRGAARIPQCRGQRQTATVGFRVYEYHQRQFDRVVPPGVRSFFRLSIKTSRKSRKGVAMLCDKGFDC